MKTLLNVLNITLVCLTVSFNIRTVSTDLDPNGQNVCPMLVQYMETYIDTENKKVRYTTRCRWVWRCTRYRWIPEPVIRHRPAYRLQHICCPGYTGLEGSNECTEPICAPECEYGTCVSPNTCNCNQGYHGPTCANVCNQDVANCEMVDCTSPRNTFCIKCQYHITNNIKSYDLNNGQCEQLCSWRADSKSCYPGTCISSPENCVCDHEFRSDANCMTIDVAPTISHCTIALQHGTGTHSVFTVSFPCNDQGAPPVYISLSGNWLNVNWQTRYDGPSSSQYSFPFYVHDFQVGVTSANVLWSLHRAGTEIANGEIDCSLNHSLDDPNEGNHVCFRSSELGYYLQNGDRIMITASSENGGYLELNNYDYSFTPIVSERTYYQGKTISRYLKIIVDLEAPTHCSLLDSPPVECGNSLAINKFYTKMNEVEVRWTAWIDDVSGFDDDNSPYYCQVCEMIPQNYLLVPNKVCTPVMSTLSETMRYEAEFQPRSPGVFCAVLAVNDIAGNTRYARRCFIFDDESEITSVKDKPMTITVNGEELNLLESDVWVLGDKNIEVSWIGHFINQLHVDQQFLLPIKVETDVFGEGYDTDANSAGRPLSAIENRNGIVKFEVGFGKDSTGGVTFPTFEPTWMSLPNDLDETFIDPLDESEDGDTYGLWVRASDVMGNTKQDYVAIHIDSTAPQIDSIDEEYNENGVFKATVFDKQSGIESVHWEILAENENILLSTGFTDSFTIESTDCEPTTCYCILVDKYCYKFVIIVTPTIDNKVESDATGFLRVTIKNNALLETSMKVEIELSDIKQQTSIEDEDGGLGTAVLAGIIAGSVLLVIIIVLIVSLLRGRTQTLEHNENISHDNPSFTSTDPVINPYAVTSAPPVYTPNAECPAPPSHQNHGIYDEEYALPTVLGGAQKGNTTATEIHPKDIKNKGEIVNGNHSVIYKANVHGHALKNVAVKSIKAGASQSEIDTIKHELKMLRKLPQHRNIVRLYGFTSTRDPVALIMEWAPSEDLSKYLQKNDRSLYSNQIDNLAEIQLSTFARQICSGMQHIQQHKIIHRNLGARNVLVGEGLVCKITDFGRAVMADIDGTFVETEEIHFPVRWTAVEGLRERMFSMKSDVWSFGVIMWEIFSLGAKPYENMPITRISDDVFEGLRLSKPTNCSDAVFSITESCWNVVPHRRPSFDALFRELSNVIGNSDIATDGEEYMGLANFQQ